MPPATRRPSRRLVPLDVAFAGGASLVLIWVTAALYPQRQAGWMALLAAPDVILVLRLAGHAGGRAAGRTGAGGDGGDLRDVAGASWRRS